MEYVGRRVKRILDGQREVFGVVEAYEGASGLCRIAYDGGDSEEVHLTEVSSLLVAVELPPMNKRVRAGNEGKTYGSSSVVRSDICDSLGREGGSFGEFNVNVNRGFDLNEAACSYLNDDDRGGNGGASLVGFDLNDAVNLESEGGLDLNKGASEQNSGAKRGLIDLNLDVNEDFEASGDRKEERCFDLNVPFTEDEARRGEKRKHASNSNIKLPSPELPIVDLEIGGMKLELGGRSEAVESGASQIVVRGRRGKKRGDLSKTDISVPTSETGLKRTRRARRATVSIPDQVLEVPRVDNINHQLPSPAIMLPPKVELPPPSCYLDLDGVSMFDFVSVYAFLRSFSTLLLSSPFDLDDFVSSVKSDDSTLLFDSIHVSLLRILRRCLVSLSKEGSPSASNCLRSINWDLLDLITWPIFVIEYLLLHSPGYIPGLDVCQLKHFQNDYYRIPVSTKTEILRHLCDDVIEMEATRAELNKRMLATNPLKDMEHKVKFDHSTKRKGRMDVGSISSATEENAEVSPDGNSDECCLCAMDGNLICCDGCPAAFHSRCAGIVTSLLPEGDWFCPECTIEKDRPWMKLRKSIRGAELLGTDPYGRMYFDSCGYLLVLELCGDESSSWFYNRNDLATLIEALDMSPFIYDKIINAICKQWNVVRGVGGTRNDNDMGDHSYSVQSTFPEIKQFPAIHPATSETLNNSVVFDWERFQLVSANSNSTEHQNAEQVIAVLETGSHGVRLENYLASSEESDEVSQTYMKVNTLNENGLACSERCPKIPDHFRAPGKLLNTDCCYMTSTSVNSVKEKVGGLEDCSCASDPISSGGVLFQVHYSANYVNCYEYAKTSSSYYEELTCKSSDKTSNDGAKYVEDIIAGQVKTVTNRFAEFSWSNIKTSNMDSRRERCGWCFYCRVPEDGKDCLFVMNDSFPVVENYTCEALGIHSGKNIKNHFVDVKCHIICIEDHLRGLLLGPWSNPQYSMIWRNGVVGANDIGSLKKLLLKLELNMHRCALSSEWRKHVDTIATMGSAFHLVSNSARVSSKQEICQKKANPSNLNTCPSSKAASGLRSLWWRGGRVSRMLFNCKVLPSSLASKAARKGGCKKIPGILYPEHGESARRTKYVSWRAAVETSRSIEQLALRLRELDANIRWDDIGNNNLLLKLGKDAKKSLNAFQKVIIQRRCSEGAVTREAVSCQHCHCQGACLHLVESVNAECIYTCLKCNVGEVVKVYARKGKSEFPKLKNIPLHSVRGIKTGKGKQHVNSKSTKTVSVAVSLRHSARSAERIAKCSLQNKVKKRKRLKNSISQKGKRKKLRYAIWKKTRTPISSSFWLNGLRLSRNPYDERLMHFRSRMLLVLSGDAAILDKPKCSLCKQLECNSEMNYVTCEFCGVWFHGDAMNLTADNIERIIGFKFHICLNKMPPVCPHIPTESDMAKVVPENHPQCKM